MAIRWRNYLILYLKYLVGNFEKIVFVKCKIVSTWLSSTKTKTSDAHCLLLHRMSSCETFIGLQELKGGAFVDTFQPFQIGKSLVDHCNKGLSEREEIQYLKSSTYKIVNSPLVVILHPFKTKCYVWRM